MLASSQTTPEEEPDAEAELREFSYIVSHDLATEIRHVAAFTRLLARELGADARSFAALDIVLASTEACERMLEALRTFSRAQQAPLQLRLCEPDLLVRAATSRVLDARGGPPVRVSVNVDGAIVGDAVLLIEAFSCVIDNAFVHGGGRQPATVEISGGPHPKGWALYVRDEGAGLERRYWEKAFRMFWRLEPLGPGRAGAGLPLCRRIVRRHGGEVRFCASERGACVEILLPQEGVGATP